MTTIFIGLIFLLMDFKININSSVIDVLPDFVGCLLITLGLRKLKKENNRFFRLIPLSAIMIFYTLAYYMADVCLAFSHSFISIFISMACDLIIMFITYNIVKAVCEMESRHLLNLSGKRLMQCWGINAFFQCLAILSNFYVLPFAFILSITTFATSILLICSFYITSKGFASYNK